MSAQASSAVGRALLTPAFRQILVIQFSFGMSWSTYLLLPKYMAAELGATGAEIGIAQALPPAMGALLVPLCGYAIDRFGRRQVVLAGLLAQLTYALAFISVERVGYLLFALQLLHGAGFTLTFNAAATLAADLAPPERLGQAMGFFGAANVVTNALAPTIAEIVEAQAGWPTALSLPVVPALLGLWLARGLPRVRTETAGADARAPRSPASVFAGVAYDAGIMLAVGAAFATVFTFYQPYALSLGIAEVRDFFLGFTAAVIFMRVGLGSVFDRLGLRRVALAAAALYVLAVLSVTSLSKGSMLALGAVFGVAHGALYPTLHALALQSVAPRERGRATAFVNGGFQVGIAACVAAVGPLTDRVGYRSAFIVGTACAVVAFLMLCLRRTRSDLSSLG